LTLKFLAGSESSITFQAQFWTSNTWKAATCASIDETAASAVFGRRRATEIDRQASTKAAKFARCTASCAS
jgi:hypothetical protein